VPVKERPRNVPQWGPYGQRRPFPEPSYAYPSGSPVKEALSRSPSHSSHKERCFVSRAFLNQFLSVPVNQLPQSSPVGPLWRKLPISGAFYYIPLGVPSKHGLLIKTKSHLSLKFPGKVAPSIFPQQGPYGERCSVSTANGLFIHSSL